VSCCVVLCCVLLQDIDPHLLLLIFLPTIGFSAALSQEPHLLRRNWGQVGEHSLSRRPRRGEGRGEGGQV
jgi:hypothetical protein